jgi:hypothetical protein
MNDIIKREEKDAIPSTSKLSKLGITAVGYSVGGVLLFVLQAVSRFRALGLIVGGVVCIFGITALLSKDPADRKPGAIVTAAGALAVLSKSGIPFITAASGTLLSIGALGLLAAGIWNGIKFLLGLKKRS